MDIRDRPYRDYLLVAGDFNSNLEELEETPWSEAIMDKLTATGKMDMGLHFLP